MKEALAFGPSHRSPSRKAARRLRDYNGNVDAQTLSPRSQRSRALRDEASGRLHLCRRQGGWRQAPRSSVEALQYAPDDAASVIAGPPEHTGWKPSFAISPGAAGVEDRVRLDLRFPPREEIAALVKALPRRRLHSL